MFIIQLILYAVFGVLMSLGGINVIETPVLFISLLLVVVAIDILSHVRAMRTFS